MEESTPGPAAYDTSAIDRELLEAVSTREEFSDALRALCKFGTPKYSPSRIAAASGVAPSSVHRIVKDQRLPDLVTLIKLLRGMEVPERELVFWANAFIRVAIPLPGVQFSPSGSTEAEQAARLELSEAEKELTSTSELTLPALWKVTHARLDYYHEIATGQARQSFRNAQVAMAVGFALLVVFAVMALVARTTTGAIVTGALGATSAAFAAYIGRTFVRSQETSASHLRSYFDQPLEFSRYLAAERLLAGVERLEPDQRAIIITEVLRGVISSPASPGGDKPNTGQAET